MRSLVDGIQVTIYKEGDVVGQTSLDRNIPQTATLISVNPVILFRLEKDHYRFILEV